MKEQPRYFQKEIQPKKLRKALLGTTVLPLAFFVGSPAVLAQEASHSIGSADSSSGMTIKDQERRPPKDPLTSVEKMAAETQLRLAEMNLYRGRGARVDGAWGPKSKRALKEWEEKHNLPRTGKLTKAKYTAIRKETIRPRGGYSVVVDKSDQTITFKRTLTNRSFYTDHVSTGKKREKMPNGTPTGGFRVGTQIAGWHRSKLEDGVFFLYYPSYFNGGIAIHGALSVPNYPASHGCVRVSFDLGYAQYRLLQKNDRVTVTQ